MSSGIVARPLSPDGVGAALAHLARDARANLFLLDLVARFGDAPSPGELRTDIVEICDGDALLAVAALRPSIVLDASIPPEAVDALLPLLEPIGVGLVKSVAPAVDRLWAQLGRRGRRRAVVDRVENAYELRPDAVRLAPSGSDHRVRSAGEADLELLVYAARESLREEHRPDPFAGDARSFRRWVQGRVSRARVVECDGRVVFAGYADVRRPDGWLLQGIYTWPEVRRRGFGTAGTGGLCREAFAGGADHVQLAVVEGNEAAQALYEGIGFERFARLRTILFA